MAQKSRNYAFTHFPKENQILKNISDIDAKYVIFGSEICPVTKREHIQGYVNFHNPLTLKGAQKKLCNYKIHLEQIKGTPEENINYCKKDGNFQELGNPPEKGIRNDLERIKKSIEEDNNTRMITLINEASNYQSIRMAELLLKFKEKPRQIKEITNLWYYGKDSKERAWADFDDDVYVPVNNKWWDGYDAHQTVIIDILNESDLKMLDRLTDKFPFRVETKGGSRQAKYTRIIFTSEDHPRTLGVNKKILNRFKEFKGPPGTEVWGNTNPDLGGDCHCETPEIISDYELRRIAGFL